MANMYFLPLLFLLFSVNQLFAIEIHWTGLGAPGVWEDPDNWHLNRLPAWNEDAVIDGPYTVTISVSTLIESVTLSNGAHFIIADGCTLSLTNDGNDGVRLNDGATMTIHGTLYCYDHGGDGIDIENGALVIISQTGSVYISDVGSDGIEMNDNLINDGFISIENIGGHCIYAKGSINRTLTNNGVIIVSGGINCIDASNTWQIDNFGTVTFSEAGASILDDGTNFSNYGVFKADGFIENGNGNDLIFMPGSTLAPGTSVGQIIFEETLNLTEVNLEIEINGKGVPGIGYDNIVVQAVQHTNGSVILDSSVLYLSGNYTPEPGDEFMILEKASEGPVTGHFEGLPEGELISFNNVTLAITYTGGDGNDIVLYFNSVLPIDLTDFSASLQQKQVKLEWATASEINNDYFTVERSADGRNFETIATVYGMGTTTEITKYQHADKNPLNGLSYYRLKQTDFDGQFSYSDIKTVEFKNDETVKVYPTLVEDAVTIETNGNFSGEITVNVRDITGKEHRSFVISSKSNKEEIALDDLTPGSYFITVYDDFITHTQLIVKQ